MHALFFLLKNEGDKKEEKQSNLSRIVKIPKFAFYGLKKEPWANTQNLEAACEL